MATWDEFCTLAGMFGGVQKTETAWQFELQGKAESRVQKVWVFREVLPPDFEIIQVRSAFAMLDQLDAESVLKNLGQLQVGAIGYTPRSDSPDASDGFLSLSSSMPLGALDLSAPKWFFLYLNLMAQAADDIEHRISVPGFELDMF